MSKIVVAIGGNALGNDPIEQKEIVKNTAKNLVDMISEGHDLVIVHGNGPQVGMINLAFDLAHQTNEKSPVVDFPECGSMSQGYIGFHLQSAINNELKKRKMNKSVASIITQTKVDKNDDAFKNPTKPIGSFYTKEQADEFKNNYDWHMKEDAGRGYRRVIASPKPIDVVEKEIIMNLVEQHHIVIACGGGGIPVYENNQELIGVPAVIDKDFAAAKIAEIINADKLFILTAVDKVMINYNKSNQQALDKISIEEAEKYISENQFAAGSMLPKVEAALSFVKASNGKICVIGNLDKTGEVVNAKSGTIFNK